MPFVYILRCGDGSLYTGIAKNLDRRLEQHRCGQASRYTRSHLPVTLVWKRKVRSWSLALREERRIKALRKAEKEAMVKAGQIHPIHAAVEEISGLVPSDVDAESAYRQYLMRKHSRLKPTAKTR
jgi:putative endonuclease